MTSNVSTKVPYELQTFNARNPLARYAHRRRANISLRLVLRCLPTNGALLDFGAGEGHILSLVHQELPGTDLYGVEIKELQQPFIQQVDSLASLDENSLDIITSFEVCEHLYEREVEQLVSDACVALKPTGKFILSVPIMYGLALLPKELNKMLMYRRSPEYSLSEITSAVFGHAIQRPIDPRHTHKGFDFRWLQKKLELQFEVEQRFYSPLPVLPWGLNSQCFWVCRPKS